MKNQDEIFDSSNVSLNRDNATWDHSDIVSSVV